MSLKVQLFGSPKIVLEGKEIRLVRKKSRALFFFVAASEKRVMREKLVSLLWPDLPRASAFQTLRTSLHGIKKSLGKYILIQDNWIELGQEYFVDVRVFENNLSAEENRIEKLNQALELYKGEFLEGFDLPGLQMFVDWMNVQREYYRRLMIRSLIFLAEEQEKANDFQAALQSLEKALSFDPLQEDIARDVIRLEFLSGDRPQAIRRYDELRKLLDREMGVPPMAETRALYDAIINDRLVRGKSAAPTLKFPRAEPTWSTPRDLPFVGRDEILNEMRSLLTEGKFVLLTGEPGVGKSRLAEEYLRTFRGFSLIGRARELEQSFPYHPLVEALRGLIRQKEWQLLSPRVVQQIKPVWMEEIGILLPELASKEPPSTERTADEARLWEAIYQFLVAISQSEPVCIFLDDLQWADSSTLALLGHLVRQIGHSRIQYLAAARNFSPHSLAGKFRQMLVRDGLLSQFPLDRLSMSDIRQIVSDLTPIDQEQFTRWLYQSSEGNPYILNELIHDLRKRKILEADAGLHLKALGDSPIIPQTVYSLIEARLAELSDPARRVLDAAVAQGREFEFEVVSHAAGLSESAALDAIDELLEAGLVHHLDEYHFVFDHSLVMEVAYREVGELRHRLLHRRIAEVIEGLYHPSKEDGNRNAQLAIHFIEGDLPERAAPYAFAAGEQALRVAAWNEAARFFQIALEGTRGEKRLPVLVALSEAYQKSGQFARATESLNEAFTLAARYNFPGIKKDQLLLRLARSMIPQARYAEVIHLVQSVCESSSLESMIAAELLLGVVFSLEGKDLSAAEEHLQKAESLWNQSDGSDLVSLAHIQFELGSVMAQLGDFKKAVTHYERSLELAQSAEHDYALDQRILAYNNLAYHLHLLNDPTAFEFAQTGLSLAQEKGVLGLQTYLYSTMGEIALAAGDLDRAEALFQQGLIFAERFSIPERTAGLTANLGLVAERKGETTLAVHRLSKALGEADQLGIQHLAAQIRIWLAPLLPRDEALQAIREAREIAENSGRKRLLEELERLEEKWKHT